MDALHLTTNLLAQPVQAHRESCELSLGAPAQQAGISKMSLSRIETRQGNPSLDVLCRIASARESSVGSLFGEERCPRSQVIRRDEEYATTSESRIVARPLPAEGRNQRAEIYAIRVPIHRAYHSLAHLSGTREFMVCLEGDLTPGPEGQEVHLHAGDSVWFSADLAHSYTSIGGAKAFLVMHLSSGVRDFALKQA